jgi:hypothetical protein
MAVPYKSSGTVHYGPLRSGTDQAGVLVVRHPCLTQHNAQPMVVDVRDVDLVQFPVWYCSQYNADFDGDEVHLYPLSRLSSVLDCEQWSE